MTCEKTLEEIKKRGYWEIIIRPKKFQKKKIPTLSECEKIIEKSVVSRRGWPYPLFKKENIISGEDWIDCYVSWQRHLEVWRFYQSGLFNHFLALREDWDERSRSLFGKPPEKPRPVGEGLSILSTLYTLTEILEFSSKLVKNAFYDSDLVLEITLNNPKNRKLFFYELRRFLGKEYRAGIESINYKDDFSSIEISSHHKEIALKICVHFFERFNWRDLPVDLFKKDQADFLKGKF